MSLNVSFSRGAREEESQWKQESSETETNDLYSENLFKFIVLVS